MFEYQCRVVKVIDGDTVDVDIDLGFGVWLHKQRVRLYGVDTPESRTRDKVEKEYGNIAKQYVIDYLPLGSLQVLKTQIDKQRGKFGRILGEFLINDTTINQMLIDNHLAVKYQGQSKDDIEMEHIANRARVIVDDYENSSV
tara:strand:- start:9318 stop:9743 length:426 start_codon:yes stop_codon:yes gene_type:complete